MFYTLLPISTTSGHYIQQEFRNGLGDTIIFFRRLLYLKKSYFSDDNILIYLFIDSADVSNLKIHQALNNTEVVNHLLIDHYQTIIQNISPLHNINFCFIEENFTQTKCAYYTNFNDTFERRISKYDEEFLKPIQKMFEAINYELDFTALKYENKTFRVNSKLLDNTFLAKFGIKSFFPAHIQNKFENVFFQLWYWISNSNCLRSNDCNLFFNPNENKKSTNFVLIEKHITHTGKWIERFLNLKIDPTDQIEHSKPQKLFYHHNLMNFIHHSQKLAIENVDDDYLMFIRACKNNAFQLDYPLHIVKKYSDILLIHKWNTIKKATCVIGPEGGELHIASNHNIPYIIVIDLENPIHTSFIDFTLLLPFIHHVHMNFCTENIYYTTTNDLFKIKQLQRDIISTINKKNLLLRDRMITYLPSVLDFWQNIFCPAFKPYCLSEHYEIN